MASSFSTTYPRGFFALSSTAAARSAEVVIPILLDLFNVRNVADVGCGDGTWLSYFRTAGVANVIGFDGDYVSRDLLKIPAESFHPMDLEHPETRPDRFDLVLSLEVAEHLSPESAERFISFLTCLGDVVCFSAAVPGQGGFHHLNEQWQSYWIQLFTQRSYTKVDCLRPQLWNDDRVAWYYVQNMFIFVNRSRLHAYPQLREYIISPRPWPEAVIHPRTFQRRLEVLNREMNMLESACRITLALPKEAILLVAGDGGVKPFDRIGARRAREFTIDPLSDPKGLLGQLQQLVKIAGPMCYLAVWLHDTPTFAVLESFLSILGKKCKVILRLPRAMLFDVSQI
jgi:SAM-dependent methyltransferase